jgi:N-acetylneuraminic acid mutarotase
MLGSWKRLGLVGVLLIAFASTTAALAQTSGTWVKTGSMTTLRGGNVSATLLQNGQVLVAGGFNGSTSTYLASAELYNPATGTWSATGSMTTVRSGGPFTATLLKDGEVLIAGGVNPSSSSALASAELYNPATRTFSPTGSMTTGREYQTATLLPDGEVLIAGGENNGTVLSSAELYNPATGTFTATGSMPFGGGSHTATLLQNGEVLDEDELYNPATGQWTVTGAPGAPFGGAAQGVLLANGDVFLVSGGGITHLYNPKTGSWSLGAKFDDRNDFSVTLLATGKVLVAGGLAYSPRPTHFDASALLYDPTTNTWQNTGSMNTARAGQLAVLLQSGQVLVAGGNRPSTSFPPGSAELYQP